MQEGVQPERGEKLFEAAVAMEEAKEEPSIAPADVPVQKKIRKDG